MTRHFHERTVVQVGVFFVDHL